MKEAIKMKSKLDPYVPEVPTFTIGDDDIEVKKCKKTYTLNLTARKTATQLSKTISLDDNTDLKLTITFKK